MRYASHTIKLTLFNLWFDLELMLMVYVQTEISIQDIVMLSSGQCSTSTPPYLPEDRTAQFSFGTSSEWPMSPSPCPWVWELTSRQQQKNIQFSGFNIFTELYQYSHRNHSRTLLSPLSPPKKESHIHQQSLFSPTPHLPPGAPGNH